MLSIPDLETIWCRSVFQQFILLTLMRNVVPFECEMKSQLNSSMLAGSCGNRQPHLSILSRSFV